jgi:hypothetical protein
VLLTYKTMSFAATLRPFGKLRAALAQGDAAHTRTGHRVGHVSEGTCSKVWTTKAKIATLRSQ